MLCGSMRHEPDTLTRSASEIRLDWRLMSDLVFDLNSNATLAYYISRLKASPRHGIPITKSSGSWGCFGIVMIPIVLISGTCLSCQAFRISISMAACPTLSFSLLHSRILYHIPGASCRRAAFLHIPSFTSSCQSSRSR